MKTTKFAMESKKKIFNKTQENIKFSNILNCISSSSENSNENEKSTNKVTFLEQEYHTTPKKSIRKPVSISEFSDDFSLEFSSMKLQMMEVMKTSNRKKSRSSAMGIKLFKVAPKKISRKRTVNLNDLGK
mmetsp:Transcript_27024/g.23854  ORF Transcript_27024/g.23854 Transcript_27024/m.23854 type:complete len:130 (+) Transcript_27024:195-584(+)